MLLKPRFVFGLLGLAAFGAAPLRADTLRIAVDTIAFRPERVAARVGDTIEWTNGDFIAHTATARDRRWDVDLPPGGQGRLTLATSGVIDYYCRFHPNMTGQIVVDER